MPTCKAIIQEGPRRGNQCTFDIPSDSADIYCGRHQRNKVYDEGQAEGKRWCRFFFRGCNNELTALPENVLSCDTCRKKKQTKPTCQHDTCTSKAMDNEQFCGKHIRDKYRIEEVEKGIKFCDIARGCFNILQNNKHHCEECLAHEREATKQRREARIKLNKQLEEIATTNQRICVKCNKEFECFKTYANKESQKCHSCFEIQAKIELSRKPRERIYKAELFNNLKLHYSNYIKNALRRSKDISLQFEEFCKLVTLPCYYCNEINEGEVNGIDRLDNDKDYTLDNSFPCCGICNRMKHYYHPTFFIDKCKIMCGIKPADEDFFKTWSNYYTRSQFRSYNTYKKEAESRGLDFNLSEKEYNTLIHSECYMCGYKQRQGIGIDRLVNTVRSYDLSNCRPCCGTCNLAKGEFDYTTLITKCLKVADKWRDTSAFDLIPTPANPFKQKKPLPN